MSKIGLYTLIAALLNPASDKAKNFLLLILLLTLANASCIFQQTNVTQCLRSTWLVRLLPYTHKASSLFSGT